jgi:signal transduction histidine kinase
LRSKPAFIIAAWTLYGFVMAVTNYQRSVIYERPIPFYKLFVNEMVYSYLWCVLTPLVLWLIERWPVDTSRRWLRAIGHMAAGVAIGAVVRGSWELLIGPWFRGKPQYAWRSILSLSFSSSEYGILNYALIGMALYLWKYSRAYKEGLERTAQLESQLANARLQALKMQVHPHFLFNTLHAISGLVREDPDAAERMIARLGEFLRMTLERANTADVTLREELDFVKRYLEIEQVRFEDRLEVRYQVESQALNAKVPNLILQPLVENAIKHGISKISDAGVLEIDAARIDGHLRLRVSDTGPGIDPVRQKPMRVGVGIQTTKERLARLFPGQHGLALVNHPGGGFAVTIHIPLRLTEETV